MDERAGKVRRFGCVGGVCRARGGGHCSKLREIAFKSLKPMPGFGLPHRSAGFPVAIVSSPLPTCDKPLRGAYLSVRPTRHSALALAERRTHALIASLALLVALLMLCFDGTRDGDLYLQMLGGRLVAQHGFMTVDPFPTIAHGELWLNQQWLTELTMYQVSLWIGVTGLTIAYAALLAAPLAILLWLCRRKGTAMMVGLTALYCPGLWVIVHPRAAGFTLLGFSVIVAAVVWAWLAPTSSPISDRRLRLALPGILVLFALWANLHGGFVAGLFLIGVVTVGLSLDRARGLPVGVSAQRVALLGLTGALAAITVTLSTPLGGAIWSYVLSFSNPAIALASSEWNPTFQNPLAIAYLVVAAAFAAWLWLRMSAPRPIAPLIATASVLTIAAVALRNVIFVGPALALQIAWSAPDRELRVSRSMMAVALAASAAAALTWFTEVGPARNERPLGSTLLRYVLEHPPRVGHIASYAGIGSYMLWRSPHAPVELDGWLEHFSPAELRGTYAVLDGRQPNPTRSVSRLRIGAVIADRHVAVRALEAHGFIARFTTPDGTYLVRRGDPIRHQAGWTSQARRNPSSPEPTITAAEQ